MEKIYSKDINKVMPILQALAEGKIIQFAATYKEWVDLDGDKDGLLLETLINNPKSYRVKPEPKFRPFKDAEECWAEMLKHHPFGWVKDKETPKFLVCKALGNLFFIGIEDKPYNYKEVLRDYTFADGTPFGIKEEE